MDGTSLGRWRKLGIVLAGYVVALLVAIVAVVLYDRRFTAADNQTMGGMIAGGEMIYFTGVFLFLALAPTALALWFLRVHGATWTVFTVAGLVFAVTGLAAVLTTIAQRAPTRDPLLLLAEVFGIAQMLGSPLFIAGFGLFAWLAPAHHLRRWMLLAAGFECVIAGFGLVHFLLPTLPF